MEKYNKVTDMQVLKKYYELQEKHYERGIWLDYIPQYLLADVMKTSEYQIKKAYRSLKEQGYMELKKYPTSFAEYDNGLYTENIPILWTKVYMLTEKGVEKAKESDLIE